MNKKEVIVPANVLVCLGKDKLQELIRCKDCEDCTETELYDGQKWNYCKRLRCVVKDDDYCSWAEKKYPKIKSKVTE